MASSLSEALETKRQKIFEVIEGGEEAEAKSCFFSA